MSLSSPPPLFQPLRGQRLQAEEGREGKKQLSLFPSPARGVKSSCNFDKAGIFALYMEMVHSHYYNETVSSKHILGEKKEETVWIFSQPARTTIPTKFFISPDYLSDQLHYSTSGNKVHSFSPLLLWLLCTLCHLKIPIAFIWFLSRCPKAELFHFT